MNSQELRILDKMQEEIEKQKEMLKGMSREIEELKTLLVNSAVGKGDDSALVSGHQRDSLDTVYGIMASLEKYTTEEVLFYAAQTLAELMDTRDVAIYTVANRDYARLFSATSAEARRLGNSIKYTDMEAMYQELKNRKVYVNRTADAELPMMASAIYAEEEMRVIVMFWGISNQRLTEAAARRLIVVETLLQNAILRASRYMASFRSKRYIEGTNVLNEEAFTVLVKTFLEAKSKGLTECTLVEITTIYLDYETVSLEIACNIRQTDYLGLMEDGKLYILLSNTDLENAEVVRERLQKLGYGSVLREAVFPIK